MPTIVVPPGFSYVLGGIVGSSFVVMWQMSLAVKARLAAGVEWPAVYATEEQVKASKKALIFNCTQRAHMNSLELIPLLWSSALIWATAHPKYSASALGFWVLTRIPYTLGYSTGDHLKRNQMQVSRLGIGAGVVLLLGAAYTTGTFILQEAFAG